jgi:hypothetical protein
MELSGSLAMNSGASAQWTLFRRRGRLAVVDHRFSAGSVPDTQGPDVALHSEDAPLHNQA